LQISKIHSIKFCLNIHDVNILGESVRTIKKNVPALVVAGKEAGIDVNANKTKYMVMSRYQNLG
jgi:hypothetical protein